MKKPYDGGVRAAPLEGDLRMEGAEKGKADIDTIQQLVEKGGIDINQLYEIAKLLNKAKPDSQQSKDEATEKTEKIKEKKLKIYKDKEFVFETRQDCFIYRDNRTKGGNYYVRIYDALTKKEFSKSLRTPNRHQALVAAEVLYREKRDKLTRGVRMTSITTMELIDLYLKKRAKEISPIPHTGITQSSYDTLISHLNYWKNYICSCRLEKKPVEKIPPEIAREFGMWILNKSKEYYKGRGRSRSTINHTIAAVKKMYKDIALKEKFISANEFPEFEYFKIPRDTAPKREVLNDEEYMDLCRWMQYKYSREKDISDEERAKRIVFAKFLTIQYNTGMRNKEQLGLRWKDIAPNPNSKDDDDYLITISADRSKTGKSRQIAAPIGDKLEAIKREYRKLNIKPLPEDYIFINLAKTKRGHNIPYETPAIERRLKKVLVGSGLKEKLDSEGRHITLYSARHYYCTKRLQAGVDVFLLALNMGTSVKYIEETYSHLKTSVMFEEVSAGQGKRGRLENQEPQV